MADTSVRVAIVGENRANAAMDQFGAGMDKARAKADSLNGKLGASGLGGSIGRLVTAATGLMVMGTVTRLFGDAARAAAAEEKDIAILTQTLQNNVGATNAQAVATNDWIDVLQRATGVADDELRTALGLLVVATKDETEAQALLADVLDISTGRHLDLLTVAKAVAKGAQGTTTSMQRLGLEIKGAGGEALTFEQIMQKANATYGGQAQKAADTTSGKLARFDAMMEQMKETAGNAVIPVMGGVVGVLDKVAAGFASLPAPIQQTIVVGAGVVAMLSGLAMVGGPAIKTLKALGVAKATSAALGALRGALGGAGLLSVLGPLGVAVAGIAGGFALWRHQAEETRKVVDSLAEAGPGLVEQYGIDWADLTSGLPTATARTEAFVDTNRDTIESLRAMSVEAQKAWLASITVQMEVRGLDASTIDAVLADLSGQISLEVPVSVGLDARTGELKARLEVAAAQMQAELDALGSGQMGTLDFKVTAFAATSPIDTGQIKKWAITIAEFANTGQWSVAGEMLATLEKYPMVFDQVVAAFGDSIESTDVATGAFDNLQQVQAAIAADSRLSEAARNWALGIDQVAASAVAANAPLVDLEALTKQVDAIFDGAVDTAGAWGTTVEYGANKARAAAEAAARAIGATDEEITKAGDAAATAFDPATASIRAFTSQLDLDLADLQARQEGMKAVMDKLAGTGIDPTKVDIPGVITGLVSQVPADQQGAFIKMLAEATPGELQGLMNSQLALLAGTTEEAAAIEAQKLADVFAGVDVVTPAAEKAPAWMNAFVTRLNTAQIANKLKSTDTYGTGISLGNKLMDGLRASIRTITIPVQYGPLPPSLVPSPTGTQSSDVIDTGAGLLGRNVPQSSGHLGSAPTSIVNNNIYTDQASINTYTRRRARALSGMG